MHNTLWIERKYALLTGSQLNRFKIKTHDPLTANFRCCYCGDSEKKASKARGYFYEENGRINFKCHNCGEQRPFWKFLKENDPVRYTEYRFECIRELPREETPYVPEIDKFNKPRFQHFEPLKALRRISQLPVDHGARKYCDNRRIPRKAHHKLYYCPKFAHWVNTMIPNKFEAKALEHDEPRLIIPLIDQNGYVFGFQGRSFRKGENVLRYITIMLDENKPKVFGLDSYDPSQEGYVVEGPIDSLFLPNCLAMAGSDLSSQIVTNRNITTLIFDNQPRETQVVKKIENAIANDYRVCIWPTLVHEKDINDLIKSGMSQSEVKGMIDSSTYRGLEARLRFNEWKRV